MLVRNVMYVGQIEYIIPITWGIGYMSDKFDMWGKNLDYMRNKLDMCEINWIYERNWIYYSNSFRDELDIYMSDKSYIWGKMGILFQFYEG